MAEKRMIHKSISVSETVNLGLTDIFHMLLFSWMIPHFDDFGRMAGSPAKVKALVCPLLLDKTAKDVGKAITEMDQIGLVYWYEVEGQKYIQAVNFEEHQPGLHKRTKSKFPEFPGNSRNFSEIPSEGKGTELNRTEENGTDTDTEGNGKEMPTPDSDIRKDQILVMMNQFITADHYNHHDLDNIYSYLDMIDVEVIEAAIKKAAGKSGSYAYGTIKGFVKDGVTKAEHLRGFQLLRGGQAYAPRPDTRRESFAPPNHADDQTSAQGTGAKIVGDGSSSGGDSDNDFNRFVRNRRA